MALGLWETALLVHARDCGVPMDSLLMLGRQSLVLSATIVDHLNHTCGAGLAPEDWIGQAWAEPLLQRLGARDIVSLDCSDYEGARLAHDLNQPWPEGRPPRQFDVVFDGGTLEHIFNLPQALLNAMSLVRPGGCLLSVTPVDGWIGHGFHQMQPEVFFRFFSESNGFKLRGLWAAEFMPGVARGRLFRLKDPAVTGCRPLVPGRRPLILLVFAEKTSEMTGAPSWPIQSNYTAMWQSGDPGSSHRAAGIVPSLRRTVMRCLPPALRESIRRRLSARKHEREARAGWVEVSALHSEARS
jgi:hypothetical protein